MTLAIGGVVAAFFETCDPVIVIKLCLPYITASKTHALTVDAWEIRLAADARPIADVERVIPRIEFPSVGRIHRGVDIGETVRDSNHIFIGPDAIERRNLITRKLLFFERQAPARMGVSDDGALLF